MQCPECKRRLSDLADACRCGWQKSAAAQRSFVHCAHETCPTCATARIKTATGWANLCERHYDEFFVQRGRDFCASRGLDTREKQISFIKRTMASLLKNVPVLREPGEDSADDIGEAA